LDQLTSASLAPLFHLSLFSFYHLLPFFAGQLGFGDAFQVQPEKEYKH